MSFVRRAVNHPVLPAAAGVLSIAFFFRPFLTSGFAAISGSPDDGRLCIYLADHWFQVLSGSAALRSPAFFFPQPFTLGYSEALFLLGLPHALFRSLGLDRFLSFEFSLIAVKAFGFASLYALARALNLSRFAASFAAALFTISNLYYFSLVRPQLQSVAFVPFIAWLLLRASRSQGRRAVLFSLAAGFSLAALYLTSFYIGWLASIAGAVLLVFLRLLAGRPFSFQLRAFAAFLASFALGLVPFFWIYLPVLRHTAGRSIESSLPNMPALLDTLNVGDTNFFWGWLVSDIQNFFLRPPSGVELIQGWPPLTLALFLIAAFAALRAVKRPSSPAALLAAAALPTFLLLWLTFIRITGRLSLWGLLIRLIPGASAIRAPGRVSFLLTILICLACAAALDRLAASGPRRALAAALLAALLLLEQFNRFPVFALNRPAALADLARLPPVPSACRSFFIYSPFVPAEVWPTIRLFVVAMEISQERRIPTLDGYSGWTPPDWDLNFAHDRGSAVRRARAWASAHGILPGLCLLDLGANSWQPSPSLPAAVFPLSRPVGFSAAGDPERYFGDGWANPESTFTWMTGPRSTLLLTLPASSAPTLEFTFLVHSFTPPAAPSRETRVLVNGRPAAVWYFGPGDALHQRSFRIPALGGAAEIQFLNSNPRSPESLGVGLDERPVTLALHSLTVAEVR